MSGDLKRECRFYENDLPEVNDLVVIQIKEVSESMFVVELLEYDRQEGAILVSDYTRSTRQSYGILKLHKHKQKSVCQVIRIDKEKRFIDLTKKNIENAQRVEEAEQKYEKGKKLQTFLYQFCNYFHMNMEDIYKQIVWPLKRKYPNSEPYDLFQKAAFDFDKIFKDIAIPRDFRERLSADIKKRLTPSAIKIRAVLEIVCLNKEAISDIRHALLLCKAENTEEMPVAINLISPPSYLLEVATMNREEGAQVVLRCLKKVEGFMKERGIFRYKDYGDQKDILEIADSKTAEDIGEEDNNEEMGGADLTNEDEP